MFDRYSRYADLPTLTHEDADGSPILYKRRRLLPRGEFLPVQDEVVVTQGDRPDLVAARALGDPLLFWQIADANNAMNPFDLTEEPGKVLRIPEPIPD